MSTITTTALAPTVAHVANFIEEHEVGPTNGSMSSNFVMNKELLTSVVERMGGNEAFLKSHAELLAETSGVNDTRLLSEFHYSDEENLKFWDDNRSNILDGLERIAEKTGDESIEAMVGIWFEDTDIDESDIKTAINEPASDYKSASKARKEVCSWLSFNAISNARLGFVAYTEELTDDEHEGTHCPTGDVILYVRDACGVNSNDFSVDIKANDYSNFERFIIAAREKLNASGGYSPTMLHFGVVDAGFEAEFLIDNGRLNSELWRVMPMSERQIGVLTAYIGATGIKDIKEAEVLLSDAELAWIGEYRDEESVVVGFLEDSEVEEDMIRAILPHLHLGSFVGAITQNRKIYKNTHFEIRG